MDSETFTASRINSPQMDSSLKHIKSHGIIAIIRGQFSLDRLLAVGETVVEAGVQVLEVTLNTSDALTAISQLRRRLDNRLLVGAGTVRTAEQLHQVINAGAQFSVAPNFDPETVAAALSHEFLHLPGVFTATEVQTAHRAGCQLLKLFPAGMFGPRYLKALLAPLDDVQFVPTGGVSEANIGEYRQAGAFACGVGSALVVGPDQSLVELGQRARRLCRAWEQTA